MRAHNAFQDHRNCNSLDSNLPDAFDMSTGDLLSVGNRSSTRRPRFVAYGPATGFGDILPHPYMIRRPHKPQFPLVQANPSDMEYNLSYATRWDALQREWKTPPLWGVRDSGPYLHDGRAITIEEAIEWHGGESEDCWDRNHQCGVALERVRYAKALPIYSKC